jgi:hypothetical protein
MDLDVGQMTPQSSDAGSSDQLTVVELDAFEIVARDQVVERRVRDEGQVVQLKNVERLRGTRCNTKLPDPFVSYQLAVRQTDRFKQGATGREDSDGTVSDENALLQVHPFQVRTVSGESLKSGVCEL